MQKLRAGFSLVELLVCMAIIGILAAMYASQFVKVKRKAEEVVVMAQARDSTIGRMSDSANMAYAQGGQTDLRDLCRRAFREVMPTAKGQIWVTRLLFVVNNDDEFRAYWHTLINPDTEGSFMGNPGGAITVKDEDGREFTLTSVDETVRRGSVTSPYMWEFISTDLGETSSGTAGAVVAYTDGHTQYIRYPQQFPITQAVAELSHRYMESVE